MLVRLVAGATALTLLASCSTTATSSTAAVASSSTVPSGTGLFDSSVVHAVSIDYDEAAYQAMIDTYVASGDKEWITATVTIDGTVFENVGIKLKGNSTLQGLRTPATAGRTPAQGSRRADPAATSPPTSRRVCRGGSGWTSSSTARTTRAKPTSWCAVGAPRPA